MENNELTHWGIKGMKWGVRRYQTKDGKLTPAGKKRYDDDVAKLKAKKAKLTTAQKNKEATEKAKARVEKLKAEVEAKKRKLNDPESAKTDKTKTEAVKETDSREKKREKLLKSSDPKELYANRHLLSDKELTERLNRIAIEDRLKNVIETNIAKQKNAEKQAVAEAKAARQERVDKIKGALDTAIEVANKAGTIYEFATTSPLGKKILEKMGIKLPEVEKFNYKKALENFDNLSDEEIAKLEKRVNVKEKVDKLQGKSGSGDKPSYEDVVNNPDAYDDDAIKRASSIAELLKKAKDADKNKPSGDDNDSGNKNPDGDKSPDGGKNPDGGKKQTEDDPRPDNGKKNSKKSKKSKKKPTDDGDVESVTGEVLPSNTKKKPGGDPFKKKPSKIYEGDFTEIIDSKPVPVSRNALGNLVNSWASSSSRNARVTYTDLLQAPAKESKIKALRSSGHTYDEIADQLGVSTTTIAGLLGAGR